MKYPGRRGKLQGENTVKTPAVNAKMRLAKSIMRLHIVLMLGERPIPKFSIRLSSIYEN
jgi:hypothetical protein